MSFVEKAHYSLTGTKALWYSNRRASVSKPQRYGTRTEGLWYSKHLRGFCIVHFSLIIQVILFHLSTTQVCLISFQTLSVHQEFIYIHKDNSISIMIFLNWLFRYNELIFSKRNTSCKISRQLLIVLYEILLCLTVANVFSIFVGLINPPPTDR